MNMDQPPVSGDNLKKEGGADVSNVILLTEEARDVLTKKLAQYRERMGGNVRPDDLADLSQLDSFYKSLLAEDLLKKGKVDATAMAEKIKTFFGNAKFNEKVFKNAWVVIGGYVKDGGKTLYGGQDPDGQRRMTSYDMLGRPR